jgi:hypothetical protein
MGIFNLSLVGRGKESKGGSNNKNIFPNTIAIVIKNKVLTFIKHKQIEHVALKELVEPI